MNAKLLKGKMVEAGYTQGKLAEAVGMAPQSFSRKINGKRQFTVGEALAVCKVLNITKEQSATIFLSAESQKCNDSEAKQ